MDTQVSQNNKTSRGLLEEVEFLAYNLQAVADHISDIPTSSAAFLSKERYLKLFSSLRQEVISYIDKDVNIDWHCSYKHCLNVVGLTKEIIQSLIKMGHYEIAEKFFYLLEDVLNPLMNEIRMFYYNLEDAELDDKSCPKCLSDYLLNIKYYGDKKSSTGS